MGNLTGRIPTRGTSSLPQPVSIVGFLTIAQFPTAATLGDGTTNPTTTLVGSMLEGFNGTIWDRLRSGLSSNASTAIGFLNILPMGQYLPTPISLASGNFQPVQVDINGNTKTIFAPYSYYTQQSLVSGYNFYGFAQPGSNPTIATWKIMRETLNTGEVLFANGSASFVNTWSAASLASISYI